MHPRRAVGPSICTIIVVVVVVGTIVDVVVGTAATEWIAKATKARQRS
jgi:phage tail tape-measure protein